MTADKKIEQLRVEPVGVLDDLLELEPWLDVQVIANMTGLKIEIQQANPPAAALRPGGGPKWAGSLCIGIARTGAVDAVNYCIVTAVASWPDVVHERPPRPRF